jgi:hypothetical protein
MKVGDLVQWIGHTGFGGNGEMGLVTEVHEQEWAAGHGPGKGTCPKWLIILWSNGDIEQLSEDDVKYVEVCTKQRDDDAGR